MKKKTWKKVIELAIVVLTALAGFLGGQVSAQKDFIKLFNNQIERSK